MSSSKEIESREALEVAVRVAELRITVLQRELDRTIDENIMLRRIMRQQSDTLRHYSTQIPLGEVYA